MHTPAAVDTALMTRKRPRSPTPSTSPPATAAIDQHRLLSFAHFTAAVRDANCSTASAMPLQQQPLVVLPGISHLLNNQSPQSQAHVFPHTSSVRQRVSTSGAFVERTRSSSSPMQSTVAAAPLLPPQQPALQSERSSNKNDKSDHPTAMDTTATTTALDNDDSDAAEDKTPWPSASEYSALFAQLHQQPHHQQQPAIPVYDLGVDPRGVPLHPEWIYSAPVSCMYFLKCSQLLGKGSFGFPRKAKCTATTTTGSLGRSSASTPKPKETAKDFEWRKMSFVTGLPKKQPVVRYITATCYSRPANNNSKSKSKSNSCTSDTMTPATPATKKKVFRMHAVMLADATGTRDAGDYVLVHIRAGGSKRVGLRASAAAATQRSDPRMQQQQTSASMRPVSPVFHSINSVVPPRTDAIDRPVSPLQTMTATYSSTAASTSPPRHKKLLHADFANHHFAASTSRLQSPPPLMPVEPHPLQQPRQVPMLPLLPRHALISNAVPSRDAAKFSNTARQAMRDLIRHSCNSRDEVATYVQCLQQELAALQQQSE